MARGADRGVGRNGVDARGMYDESKGVDLDMKEVGVLVS